MMKPGKHLLRVLAASFLFFAVACKKDAPDEQGNPETGEGVFITLGAKTYTYTKAFASGNAFDFGIQFQKTVGANTYFGTIDWKCLGTGTRPWSESDTQFGWEPEDFSPRSYLQSYYDDGMKVSTGNVNVTRLGAVGELVEGTFSVTQAGQTNIESGNGEYLGSHKVTGHFKVKRTE
jgi:hypothetical protein